MLDTVIGNDLGTHGAGSRTGYVLQLYITGNTLRAQQALRNIKRICENELLGRYDLEVIDIYQQPELAKKEQILAAPTLIRKRPLPLRKIVGDMSNRDRVVAGLEIKPDVISGREGK